MSHPEKDEFRQDCEWVRAKDLAERPALFSTVEPADACQGALGDCWLIAALAGGPFWLQSLVPDFRESKQKR